MATWKEKRKIKQLYDASAETYEGLYREEQGRKYCKALEKVDVSGVRVLDVGCGSGLFFPEVEAKASLVVGVDVSRNLLLKAKGQARASSDCFVVQADADHLPFKEELFCVVFSFTVLQNMPKPGETLAEMQRVTMQGGKVVVTGLKKAIPLEKFMDILEASTLKLTSFIDDDAVNCYVAVLSA